MRVFFLSGLTERPALRRLDWPESAVKTKQHPLEF